MELFSIYLFETKFCKVPFLLKVWTGSSVMRCVPLIFRMYEFSPLPKKVMYELKMSISALRKNSLKQLLSWLVLILFSWQMSTQHFRLVYLSLLVNCIFVSSSRQYTINIIKIKVFLLCQQLSEARHFVLTGVLY